MVELSKSLSEVLRTLAKSAEIARSRYEDPKCEASEYEDYLKRILVASEIIGGILARMAVNKNLDP